MYSSTKQKVHCILKSITQFVLKVHTGFIKKKSYFLPQSLGLLLGGGFSEVGLSREETFLRCYGKFYCQISEVFKIKKVIKLEKLSN